MDVQPLLTTAEVMDALGGTGAVAVLTGSKPSAASNWRGFDTFPANTYVAMKAALEARGLTAPDSLWGMKAAAEERRMRSCPTAIDGCKCEEPVLWWDGIELCRACVDFIASQFVSPPPAGRQAVVVSSASPSHGAASADLASICDDIGGIDDKMKSVIADMRQSVPRAAPSVITNEIQNKAGAVQ